MVSLNLKEVPFSTRGSYLVVSDLSGEFHGKEVEEGLYLRTVHGSAQSSVVARIMPLQDGEICNYTYEARPEELRIWTDKGAVGIAFADTKTIVVHGNMELGLDFLAEGKAYTFAQPLKAGDREYWMVNSSDGNSRYMMRAQIGGLHLEQKWDGSSAKECRICIKNSSDRIGTDYTIIVEENYEEWQERTLTYDYGEIVSQQREAFQQFYASMPEIPEEYQDAAEMAAYVDWASMVEPCGLLRRETMFMSKNWMCNVWSWDHCFNALALAYHNPKEAWNQFMVMFDYQSPSGRIPDCMNDTKIIHNFCKPPIHGWTLRKLMQVMEISQEQRLEAYDKLSKWTNWWLNCRDENGDGLCEYTHGNDSGWDNSTAFIELPPVTLPDLASFLILQMDVLHEVANQLQYHADARMWEQRSAEMMERMLAVLFPEDQPRALAGISMQESKNQSLILYLPIVLGAKLPDNVRNNLIAAIKGDRFHTSYGLATESPKSSAYEPDGYWRGPIWAPSTMLILDGMMECGERDYVQEVTHEFCKMVQNSGCAENYNALTGEGLRDRAYTWTASIMLVMAHEYLTP